MRKVLCALAGALAGIWPAGAADHRNLDARVPIAVEDAYPVKFRELTLQALFPYRRLRGGGNEGGVVADLEYGLARDVQVNIGTEAFGRTRGRNEGSGDLGLGVLYNFNTETLRAPAFALKAEAELPSGVDSRGADLALTGILTRSHGHNRFHLKVGHTWLTSAEPDERRRRWQGVAGWDRPVGLQSLLIVGVVAGESEGRGNPAASRVEVGLRRQMTPRLVASVGAGFGLSGGPDRQPFFLGVALSRSF